MSTFIFTVIYYKKNMLIFKVMWDVSQQEASGYHRPIKRPQKHSIGTVYIKLPTDLRVSQH
jgi:hypothetical protein